MFSSLILPHNDKVKTDFRSVWIYLKEKLKYHIYISTQYLKHLWQQLQPRVFWGMMQQALHSWIEGFSVILLCKPSLARSGWMGTLGGQPFSGLSRDVSIGFKSGLWLGHSRTFTELTPNVRCCLGCVLSVIILLEGEPSALYEVLNALESGLGFH